MRAMIVAAGLGTRLRPLTELLPKPALPVRGLPLIAHPLALLARHGVSEVVINTHHLPERLEAAAREHCPPGLALRFSRETELLDTGGGIRRVAGFLAESDPCLILGGDMLLDADLGALLGAHSTAGGGVTMLLREDPRSERFGSIGVDAEGVVCRIGSRHRFCDPDHIEARSGVYVWANVVSARTLTSLPESEVFSHFDGWLAPRLAAGARDVLGVFQPCLWEPVGTVSEYLSANFEAHAPSYFDADARARARGVGVEPGGGRGAGARLGPGARLERVVVWDGESVPAGFQGRDGVWAGGRFVEAAP